MKLFVINDKYQLNIDDSDTWLRFSVYPIARWVTNDRVSGIAYISNNSSDTVDVFDEDKIRILFKGTYCWRGVWESRIYFTDDEYWGEELVEISKLFTSHIEPICKNLIRLKDERS